MSRRLEFHLFGYGSYPEIPHADQMPHGPYVDLPNRFNDPLRGQLHLESYLDMLVFGEKVGFDGILTTAQMNGPVGLTPQPNLAAAYLAARTERILIGTIGPILNVYSNPMRAAEELAMLDVMTGGRLIAGLPMGHGQNWHSMSGANPTYARERHWEAHDLIMKAWREPGPFEWVGKHFHVPYANLWPRPLQKELPVWIPAAGSRSTFERCAEHRYTYQNLFSPRHARKRNVEAFRKVAREHGYEADPKQIAVVLFIHVAESDAQARLEAEPHLMWVFQCANKAAPYDAFAPGHFSVDSMRGFMSGAGYRQKDLADMTYDELIDEAWALVGSPETVAAGLDEVCDELDAGRIVFIADFGAMPNWMVRKSLTLFAEHVMPRYREPGGAPVWAQDPRPAPTIAQLGAALGEPEARPEARIYGHGVIDVRTGHVADKREPIRP